MNTLLRRFFILAAVLLCCTATANAKNPDAVKIDGIYYILDDGNHTATVTWGGEMMGRPTEEYSGDIVIPEKFTDHNIEYTVTSIGDDAFENCSGLTSIRIPNSVTSIGDRAFLDCSGLTSITIPSTVTSIGNNAFAYCNRLKSIYVSWETPLAISDYVFSDLSTSEITLHVPYGTLDAYRTANVWSTFNINDEAVHFADANAEAISIENWDSNHDGHLSYEEAAAVTDLGDAFSNSTITSFNELKYFKNLTSIGDNAFKGTSITSIEIPTTITSIGNSAFENCTNLKAVTIPATVTSIGESAFKNCTGIEEIYVKNQSPLPISSNVFENVATTCLLRVPYGSVLSYEETDVWKDFSNIQDNAIQFEDPEVKAICLANWDTNKDSVLTYEEAAAVRDLNRVFENNTTITSFNELKYFTGITTMWWDFSDCTNLKEITIPNGVTSINAYTFQNCTNLASVTILGNVANIESYAFQNCTNLASITIPNSVAYIETYAFDGCTNLQNIGINIVDFANNNIIYDYFGTSKTIKYYYNGEEISGELTIPSTTTSIGNNAFKGVSGLTSVTIPNSVTSIGSNAFYGCTNLQNIGINIVDFANNNIIYDYFGTSKTIKYYYNGSEISGEFVIPETTTSIGKNLLQGCTGLTSITIPNSVTSIGDSTFYNCSKLATVTFAEGSKLESIGAAAFYNCWANLTSITIPSGVTSIGDNAFNNCSKLASVTFAEGSKLESIGAAAFYQNYALTSITIPSGITSISDSTFYNCRKLASVTFAEGSKLESIGASAFYKNYALASITIPSAVTSIGDIAFAECDKLASVTFEEGSKLESIGAGAFAQSYALASITIPNSVTSIGMSAFYNCSGLESITVQWTEAEKIPDISEKYVFEGITQSDVMLHVPFATKTLYKGTNVWKEFKLNEEIGILIVKADDSRIKQKFPDVSDFSIDESNNDIKNIVVPDDVDAVSSITYTRDFSAVIGKWQCWFVPFEAPVSALNDAELDVAEVAGILLDEDENTIVAFKKVTDANKKLNANTPYVVRLKADATNKKATLVFENANLKATEEDSFSIQSAYDIFTFTGNYETQSFANSYSLNTKGEFQKMANDAVLGPMRFSLAVTPRDDSPYADETPNSSPRPAIRYMILGDDSSLQPIDGDLQQDDEKAMRAMTPAISLKPRPQQTFIYDLRGRKVNRIQSKQVYIIDGKKFIAR